MNVMFCLGSLGIGGAERVISNLADTFVKENNNKVSIVVSTPKEKIYQLDKKIRFEVIDSLDEKNKIKKIVKRIIKTKKIIKDINPDIIVAFLPEPSIRIAMLRKQLKIPTIISVRDDPKVDYKKMKMKLPLKLFFKNVDGFVFQTEEQKRYFSKSIQDKSTIIFNPINSKFICDPYIGKRNNPSMVKLVAQRVSEVKKVPIETVTEITYKNANKSNRKISFIPYTGRRLFRKSQTYIYK